MPTKVEKDSVTGTETTGHEWDGIRELDTPLPRWWLWVFYATIAFSAVWVVLYPAIPGISSYTRGILGYDQRERLAESIATAREARSTWVSAIESTPLEEIAADPDLMAFAMAGGRAAFADNCAPCHGQGGAGRPGGYPVLADDEWLWGGTREEIHATILHGVRSGEPEARLSEMPAFGALGVLTREEVGDVADYVLSLGGRAENEAAAGREVFAVQCAACHGESGQGTPALGAPNLADAIWLYGGERADILAQVTQPRHGVMPAWSGRLDPATVKMLAIYVHALGGGR
jgi:cytochrome c oxidase cbb3-type subunit 3